MQKIRAIRRVQMSGVALALAFSLASGVAGAQAAATTTKAAAPAAAGKGTVGATATKGATTKGATPKTTSADGQAAGAPATEQIGPSAEQQAQARSAFEAGKKAYDAGDYVTAEAEFKKAYELIPIPHAEYWIAASVDKQNKDAAATVAAYELFLSNPGASHVGEDKVAESKARVAELKKTLPAKYTFTTTTPGATVTVDDGAKSGTTPFTVELTPGTHKVHTEQPGYESATAEIVVEGGSLVEQPLALTQLAVQDDPAAAAPPPPPPEPRSKVPAYVTLGLGAAGLISGTVFGILALDAKSQYDSNPTSEKADEVERNALIADMSFGVALTLGITGIVLLTSGDEPEQAAATAGRLVVAPYASHTGGGAAAHLTF